MSAGKDYFTVLMAAINIAKREQIQSVEALRTRLLEHFNEERVDGAMELWVHWQAMQ